MRILLSESGHEELLSLILLPGKRVIDECHIFHRATIMGVMVLWEPIICHDTDLLGRVSSESVVRQSDP